MSLQNDLQYSLRLLRKTPVHTAITLFVMVLGLSLYLVSYVFAKNLTDKPMPFPDGNRYVVLKAIDPLSGFDEWRSAFDSTTYDRLKSTSDSYSLLAAIQFSNATLSDDGSYAKQVESASLSVDFLSATSVNPLLGRLFTPEDAALGAPNVAIISYTLWQDYYGGDPGIIGTISRINNQSHNIIGVMPEGFSFPLKEDLWFPYRSINASQLAEKEPLSLAGILQPGVTLEAAETELNALVLLLSNEFPEDYRRKTALVTPYAQAYITSVSNIGLMILVLAFMVLSLTVVNLSSLLFMRSTSRKQELAVRATQGAGGLELAKQVLLESAAICLTGLVLSLATSEFLLNVMGSFSSDMLFWQTLELSLQTVLTGITLTVAIWLCSGLVVAYTAWLTDPGILLSDTNTSYGTGGKGMAGKVIVIIEVVLSCFLLVVTGVMMTAVPKSVVTDFGVPIENTAIARFNLSQLDTTDQRRQLLFVDELIREVREIPGVTEVAVTTSTPGREGRRGVYQLDNYIDPDDYEDLPTQGMIWVSNNYFDTIGIELIEGRGFDSSDSSASESVTIITDEFAQKLWPQESPLGKTIYTMMANQEKALVVVGTIPSSLKQTNSTMRAFITPSLYRPISQDSPQNLFLLLNHQPQLAMDALEQAIRTAGVGVDRNVAIEKFGPLKDDLALPEITYILTVAEGIALTTFILAFIGVYAVLARSITQRTNEIGIRRALGSTNFMIFQKFIKQGMSILLVGTILGSSTALILIAYGISELSTSSTTSNYIYLLPSVWLAVTLLMFFIIAVACYIPTRGAIFKEPAEALRYE